MSYKLLRNTNAVLRLIDKVSIPADESNRDWQEYQAWLSVGNTPLEADLEPPPSSGEVALSDAKQWLLNNPGAKQIWELSLEDLESQVISQINELYPVATPQAKNKERLSRMANYIIIRRIAKQLGLSD